MKKQKINIVCGNQGEEAGSQVRIRGDYTSSNSSVEKSGYIVLEVHGWNTKHGIDICPA